MPTGTASPLLAAPHASPAERVAGATPPAAARQLSPALVQLGHGPSGGTVTLQLDPAGLGHVQVRIERDPAGAATVQITAEHPETLRLLVADQPQLHRALDTAGVAADGRTLAFALSTPADSPAATSGGPGGGMPGGSGGGGGAWHGGNRRGRQETAYTGPQDDAFPLSTVWRRAGVDITA